MVNEKRIRLTTILFALFIGIATLLLKLYAAKISGSSALRSDALEGTVNVAAALFGLVSILVAEKPADQDHPYGHGKIEYFSAAFEGGLIALAGILILVDTILRIIHHTAPEDIGSGLKINILAGILNGISGGLIYLAGKKYRSQVLIADGIHLLTDLMTTIVLGAGLGLVLITGWKWLDPALAIGVACFILYTGYLLLRESLNALLDGENPELIGQIVNHLNRIERKQVITIHELKAQEFGRAKHVDIHLVVPEFMSVKEAHEISDEYANSLKRELGTESLIHTHIDPCERLFCKECAHSECPVRQAPCEGVKPITLESAVRSGTV